MKKAIVNGQEIGEAAVNFELDRLVRFYMSHGMTMEEVKNNLPQLQERALEQAIGAKLLLARTEELEVAITAADIDAEVAKVVEQIGGEENFQKALDAQGITRENFRKELEKGAKVNKLVAQACSGVPEPTEAEVADFFEAHKADERGGGEQTLVDVHDQIKDLLRHEARGRAMDAFVAELREKAEIKYVG